MGFKSVLLFLYLKIFMGFQPRVLKNGIILLSKILYISLKKIYKVFDRKKVKYIKNKFESFDQITLKPMNLKTVNKL